VTDEKCVLVGRGNDTGDEGSRGGQMPVYTVVRGCVIVIPSRFSSLSLFWCVKGRAAA